MGSYLVNAHLLHEVAHGCTQVDKEGTGGEPWKEPCVGGGEMLEFSGPLYICAR
jgi:hypothetical protein